MRLVAVTILLALARWGADAQIAKSYRIGANAPTSNLPASNSVSDIVVKGDTVWFGTDKGLSRTVDRGRTFSNFSGMAPFNTNGVSAVAMNDAVIWVAGATSFTQDNQSIPQGDGLYFSTDRGLTWNRVPQPVDVGLVDTIQYGINRIKTLDITTTANNITYDVAVTSNAVWIANFAGMLRKSTDLGATWSRVVLPPDSGVDSISPTDTLDFDLSPSSGRSGLRQNLNHRVFSVFADGDSILWVGTAGGINRSTDGGVSWVKFVHKIFGQTISGNFVVAINQMVTGGKKIIWAATVNAEGSDERRGVSFSEDGGATWKTTLLGEFAHNIACRDSLVYVVTDNGLFRSSDMGNSWLRSGTIFDASTLQQFATSALYAVGVLGDTVWTAGPDGIAYTIDSNSAPFGTQWTVLRTYKQVGASPTTYSYPLPFSPSQEVVRIHYSVQGSDAPVTIRIFDFAMQPVRVLLRDAVRSSANEHDEIWDGRDDHGRRVTNGVYFYRIEVGNKSPVWGKILAIQ